MGVLGPPAASRSRAYAHPARAPPAPMKSASPSLPATSLRLPKPPQSNSHLRSAAELALPSEAETYQERGFYPAADFVVTTILRNVQCAPRGAKHQRMQHFLYFLPLPQGQGSLRPIFVLGRTGSLAGPEGAAPKMGAGPRERVKLRPSERFLLRGTGMHLNELLQLRVPNVPFALLAHSLDDRVPVVRGYRGTRLASA